VETPSPRRWLRRVTARIPFYVAIPASLLAFPSILPWVLLFWIGAYAFLAYGRKPAWLPLLIGLAVTLVRRVDWGQGLLVLAPAMLMTAAIDWRRAKIKMKGPAWLYPAAPLAAQLLALGAMALEANRTGHRSTALSLRPDQPIVVIGDSISVHGWPGRLAKRLSVSVIDRSEGGINTTEGLAKLPDVLALHPQLVVIELGGHDYLEGRGRAATKENLEKIIRKVREADAEVLLFEIPRGFVMDPFAGLERELARDYDLELVTDGAIRQLVLFSPFTPLGSLTGRKLSDDGLHPNEAGHRFLAERVKESLVRLYGTPVLAAGR
jgi:lysophospholipase L1-like esterase